MSGIGHAPSVFNEYMKGYDVAVLYNLATLSKV
jgi:hypothetical protein